VTAAPSVVRPTVLRSRDFTNPADVTETRIEVSAIGHVSIADYG